MTRLRSREFDVIDALTSHPGWKNAELAHFLGMSEGNVQNRLAAVYAKYDVPNRAAAIQEHARRRAKVRRRPHVAEGQMEMA